VIPYIVRPLTGLTVLVTRPQPQANELAAGIVRFGGEPIVFPTIAIEPIEAVQNPETHDLVIFVSVHAVEHGARLIHETPTTRIAAIGKATAAALSALNLPADIVPDAGFTSESLLAHPDLQVTPGQRALIVRGAGGRDLLRDSLSERGLIVNTLEVYRRVQPNIAPETVTELHSRWIEHGVDVITATSLETFQNLTEMISDQTRTLLRKTSLVAPSQRIIDAARETGWNADGLVTGGADDASILGTIARWRARARGT
jgi:uroporphyrinogen-III synthase